MRTCSYEECTAKHYARGFCKLHYVRWVAHGDPSGSGTCAGPHPRLYSVLNGMIQRCTNPKNASYHRYGGRGIAVCPEWRLSGRVAFRDWAFANGYVEQPENTPLGDRLSIDRVDNDGDYEPANCQWVPQRENSRKKWVDHAATR